MLLLAFRNLFRNKRRTLAVLLTIALGTGALFCFQGFIHAVLVDYQDSTIHSHYGDGEIHRKGFRETSSDKPWNQWIDNPEELEAFLRSQEGVAFVFPRVSIAGMLSFNRRTITGYGQGVLAEQEAQFFRSMNIEQGKMLSSEENGILLGKGLAEALQVSPGDTVTLYTRDVHDSVSKGKFVVTGIFHTGLVDFDNRVFRIQLGKAQEMLATDKIETASVGLTDHSYWDNLAKATEEKFPDLEASSFAQLDKVYYQNSVDWLEAQFHVVQIIILSIVLLGIFNTVSTSVFERKQEFGNLRANGESVREILALIVSEGALLGLFGTFLGLSLSFIIAKGGLDENILMPPGPGSTKQALLSFNFTSWMVLYTAILGILSTLVASFLAGLKAAKMPISKALRSF